MSDEIDRAREYEQVQRDYLIESARRYKSPVATGLCLYCSSEVSNGLRWCNSDCRNDYERLEPSRLEW